MVMNYDKDFCENEMFKLHPTFLPYVGDCYEEYKIIHIGESHYINQTPENEKYDISYFKKWWSESCEEVILDNHGWADTRLVLDRYMNEENGKYPIFTNFIKSFSKIVLGKTIENVSIEDKKLYKYIAFMNFFQMPSIYEGMKFWDALAISAKKLGDKDIAYDMWDEAVKHSVNTVDRVIEILKPRAIVFTSISAGEAYKMNGGKYKNENRIIYTSHPGYPFTWWKKLKSLNGKKGIEIFEEGLINIYK